MSIDSDADLLLAHLDSVGVDAATQVDRAGSHMGGLIVDAALQRRQRYKATVAPRVRALIAAWPDAATTSGFLARLAEGDLGSVIRWSGSERLQQIAAMAEVFKNQGIETVAELRDRLDGDPAGAQALRSALRTVRDVGPKTVDYVGILAGVTTRAAIDSRVRRVMKAAGVVNHDYDHVAAVINDAATKRGWRTGDLDAVIWEAGA